MDASYGPDIWQVEVDGGEILLTTTFSNLEENSWQQNFPNSYGGGSHPAATGAQKIDSLGYDYFGDSIYQLEFGFRHESGPITLLFSATGLQGLSDESWGLSNLRVAGARVRSPEEINAGELVEAPFTQRPELTRIEILEARSLDPIDEIAIGESFKVRLTYAEDPATGISEIVTVRTSDGAAQEVRVTGSVRVIVSDPILVVPAESDRTKVEP